MRRFMVIDMHQLILIEPDNRRLGFGVSKFVALLQDVEVSVDKDDSRSLHITIRQSAGSANPRRVVLNAKFVFDDHIRCMAAKQRLTKGRAKARQRKMHQIAKLLELGALSAPPTKRSSSQGSSNRDIPRSQSQEAFSKRHSSNSHKPLCRVALPGVAVADNGQLGGKSKSNVSKKLSGRRRSASSLVASTSSRDASPRPTTSQHLDPSEEMIPLEDLSPKNDRRRNRSRSEVRADKTVTIVDDECSERV